MATNSRGLRPGSSECRGREYLRSATLPQWTPHGAAIRCRESQPDVYPFALALLGACGASKVIDIGCGNGGQIEAIRRRRTRPVVGIDYGANIWLTCRRAMTLSAATGAEVDLARLDAALCKVAVHRPRAASVLIIADVIEH